MSEETQPKPKEQQANDEQQVSNFQPPEKGPNGQMDQGQQYTSDELNVIMNLIHGCTIKGSDAPVINALGVKTATMLQDQAK
jgi:hypothetical protein